MLLTSFRSRMLVKFSSSSLRILTGSVLCKKSQASCFTLKFSDSSYQFHRPHSLYWVEIPLQIRQSQHHGLYVTLCCYSKMLNTAPGLLVAVMARLCCACIIPVLLKCTNYRECVMCAVVPYSRVLSCLDPQRALSHLEVCQLTS